MWSQKRHTIETDDQNKGHQAMLKMSSSGRISLRQRSRSSDKRLSLFGNATESLMNLLHHPEMLHAFRTFLKSEYSEENLDFYLECEAYKTAKPHRRKMLAERIYATYLDSKAPKEVNIDAETRARTESRLKNPQGDTFHEAQKHIFDLMESDSFRRFVTTSKLA